MSPKVIADALGKQSGAVRYLLHKMVKAGEVEGVGGAYRLPFFAPNSPNGANGATLGVKRPERRTIRVLAVQRLALTGRSR